MFPRATSEGKGVSSPRVAITESIRNSGLAAYIAKFLRTGANPYGCGLPGCKYNARKPK